jgi:hypothetical protein
MSDTPVFDVWSTMDNYNVGLLHSSLAAVWIPKTVAFLLDSDNEMTTRSRWRDTQALLILWFHIETDACYGLQYWAFYVPLFDELYDSTYQYRQYRKD